MNIIDFNQLLICACANLRAEAEYFAKQHIAALRLGLSGIGSDFQTVEDVLRRTADQLETAWRAHLQADYDASIGQIGKTLKAFADKQQ